MKQDHNIHSQKQQAQATAVSLPTFTPQHLIGLLLLIALLAFELFNFDTTQYALTDFFGDTSFAGLRWATILAIAFCAIDFAGLIRFFTPEREGETATEVWYLMGAWMLAATLNALMTWWAVTLTLLNHDLGNEILSREELLRGAPLLVAALVWLTRVLFIGAFTVAGGHLFNFGQTRPSVPTAQRQHPRQAGPTPPARSPTPQTNRATNGDNRRNSQPAQTGDKRRSFPFARPFMPRLVPRKPTAVYAHSRHASHKE